MFWCNKNSIKKFKRIYALNKINRHVEGMFVELRISMFEMQLSELNKITSCFIKLELDDLYCFTFMQCI